MKKWVLPTIIGGSSLVVGGGIATGIILPSTLKLKDGLSNFVPGDGSSPMGSWNEKKKLNYVALGDSETAGFNGFLQGTPELGTGVDYVSYADILAHDLQNSGNLGKYHNFAVSGATIPDQQKMFGENQLIHKTVKEADLITVTIGANDLLSFVRLLDLPFKLSLNGLMQTLKGEITDYNAARDAIFGPTGHSPIDGQPESPSTGPTSKEASAMLHNSINLLKDMVESGDYSHIINLEEDFKDKVFDLIYRNFMMFIHDLREVAPHAQILVLGHAMPFAQWPKDTVLDKPRADMHGQTIRQLYQRMITKMREGATFALTGSNNYTTFMSVDDLKIKKSADGTHETDARDGEGKKYTDYIKHGMDTPDYYIRNAMPNAADIHPSTFGHQLIGNAVYDYVAAHLGIRDAVSNYTYTTPFDGIYSGPLKEGQDGYEAAVAHEVGLFERIDENPNLGHTASTLISGILSNEGILPGLLKSLLPYLSDIEDFSSLTNILSSGVIEKITNDLAAMPKGALFGKLVQLLTDPANADTVKMLTDDLKSLLDVNEKTRTLRDALLSVLDILKVNNASSAWLTRSIGELMKDKHLKSPSPTNPVDMIAGDFYYNTTLNKWREFDGTTWSDKDVPEEYRYTDLNDYLLGEYGIVSTKVTKAQITSYVDQFATTFKSLLKIIAPSLPDSAIPSIDGFKKLAGDQFDLIATHLPTDANALAASYAGAVQAVTQTNLVSIGTPTSAVSVDDLFNYMIITNILDKNKLLVEGYILPLMALIDKDNHTLSDDVKAAVKKDLAPLLAAAGFDLG